MLFRNLAEDGAVARSDVEIKDVEDAAKFYPAIHGYRFNFVTAPGITTNSNSSQISNSVDRLFLRAIRSTSDLIITTGQTARKERLRASQYAPMLVLTRASVEGVPLVDDSSKQEIFLTTESIDYENPNAKNVGSVGNDLAKWLSEFTSPYDSVLLETGLSVAKCLADAKMIDEVCMTVTRSDDYSQAHAAAFEILSEMNLNVTQIHCLKTDNTWLFRFKVLK